MKLSLIIPAYNEESIIASTVMECERFLKESFPDFELIIVNDGSYDHTQALASIAKRSDKTKIISRKENRGKGYSVREGVLASSGDIVCYTDADLAFGLDVLKDGVKILRDKNADLLLGSRQNDGYKDYPLIRKIASKALLVFLHMMGLKYSDSQCGIKVLDGDFSRRVFEKCRTEGFAFDIELILIAEKMGARIDEFSVEIINNGDSSVSLIKDSLIMLREIFRIKSYVKKI